MNFLAHCALAANARTPEDAALIVGGFLGDFHKGLVSPDLPDDIQRGIRLHRRIDAYSNQQPDIKNSIRQFSPTFRRMAPVYVDILADHYLAQFWQDYHNENDLLVFCQRTYQQIESYRSLLPDSGRKFFDYMVQTNLLAQYQTMEAPLRAMVHTSKRIGLGVNRGSLELEVARIDGQLREDFAIYYPHLLAHCRDWLRNNRLEADDVNVAE